MRGESTETVTYKCEGCGQRKAYETYWDPNPENTNVPAKAAWHPWHMVCSRECWDLAERAFLRQNIDACILALVDNR
jgi:hypothetical protein